MTKQEKIKEAYGIQWDKVKCDISEDGWVESGYYNNEPKLISAFDNFQEEKDFKISDFDIDCSKWRPKSLNGI